MYVPIEGANRIVAFAASSVMDARGVKEALSRSLPRYMLPDRVIVVRELMKNANGNRPPRAGDQSEGRAVMNGATETVCAVCSGTEWHPLPRLDAGRSITTAGNIVSEPLGKSHCRRCGLVQRTAAPFLARTDFYEKHYSFYERPGASRFDCERYSGHGDVDCRRSPAPPARVLDAGCGRGWMLDAMASLYPESQFSGIEPSESESHNARRRGFDVITGRVGGGTLRTSRYDLIYSTNVLEHAECPAAFLANLRSMLAADGRIVITCPDASRPNAEMLFSDQNFSFMPSHLERSPHRRVSSSRHGPALPSAW